MESNQLFLYAVLGTDGELVNSTDPSLALCGINFCHNSAEIPVNTSEVATEGPISSSGRLTLTIVFSVISLAAPLVIMLLVSPLSK